MRTIARSFGESRWNLDHRQPSAAEQGGKTGSLSRLVPQTAEDAKQNTRNWWLWPKDYRD
jgi:hypothetical protein